jgi:hypothetical protein
MTHTGRGVKKHGAVQQDVGSLNGTLWNIDPRPDRSRYSLILAARITLAHFSVSSAMSRPKSAGDPLSTLPP